MLPPRSRDGPEPVASATEGIVSESAGPGNATPAAVGVSSVLAPDVLVRHPREVDDESGDREDRAPICPACGVTALPAETANVLDSAFVCENPDCEAYGEVVPEP